MRTVLAALLFTCALHASSYLDATSFLLDNATATDTATDAAGNLYIAGSSDDLGVFVMKLSPDLGQRLYLVSLNGDNVDTVTGLAVTPNGDVLITGTTTSSDFPVTPGAYQPVYPAGEEGEPGKFNTGGFVAKFDSEGNTVYVTFLGGESQHVRPSDIAANAAGEAFVTGTYVGDDFPLTPGALNDSGRGPNNFIVRLNAGGTDAIYSLTGHGGRRIAVDAADKAIATGHAGIPDLVPTTAGALQAGHPDMVFCYTTKAGAILCAFQFIHKVNPDGTELLFGTFLDGSYGAENETVLVDDAGDIYLGGSTISPDFPTTDDVLQRVNRVPYLPELVKIVDSGPFSIFDRRRPTNGYVAKLSSDGSRLIFSTYLGGTVYDAVGDLTLMPDGSIAVSGGSQSPDLPGLGETPYQCASRFYVLRMAGDGSSVSATTGLPGVASLALDPGGRILAVGSSSGIDFPMTEGLYGIFPTPSEVDGGVYVARFSLDDRPATALACIHDAADDTPLGVLAPGHLVTLFGTNLDGDVRVLFDGRPGRLLYESATQINAAAPFDLAGQDFTFMELEIDGAIVARERLRVVPNAPSLFMHLADLNGACFDAEEWGPQVFSLTGDVRINTCSDMAAAGSTISLFLNGVGLATPPLSLVESADRLPPLEVEWAEQGPPEVWRIQVHLPADARSRNDVFRLYVGDVPARTPASYDDFRIPFQP